MRWVNVIRDTPRTDGPPYVRGRRYLLHDAQADALIQSGNAEAVEIDHAEPPARRRETAIRKAPYTKR
jgi:hypothetical protein